ncbi:MAG: hypothetical protein ACREHG_05845 [Candidatus Saccharimonadales bacterium]
MSNTDVHDPFFIADKAKTISWKDAREGATIHMVLDGPAAKVRGKDIKTGEPATWPDSGDPKLSAVVTGDVKGQRRSLWATIPSNLFYVLADAQDKAGQHFSRGGKLSVTFKSWKENDNPALNAARQFAAAYVPPTPEEANAGSDPWDSGDEPPF